MSKNWHKWHLNRKTGEVGECHAEKIPCPFGGDENHFPSRIGAIYAYEEQQRREGNLFTELKSKKENPHYAFANEVFETMANDFNSEQLHYFTAEEDLDNNESMRVFLEENGLEDFVEEDEGTLVYLKHEDYDFMLAVTSEGAGDFFSHNIYISVAQDDIDRLEQEQIQVNSWADATDEDLAEMTDFYETEEAARQARELSQKKRPISSRLEEAAKKRRETPFEWPTGGPPPF